MLSEESTRKCSKLKFIYAMFTSNGHQFAWCINIQFNRVYSLILSHSLVLCSPSRPALWQLLSEMCQQKGIFKVLVLSSNGFFTFNTYKFIFSLSSVYEGAQNSSAFSFFLSHFLRLSLSFHFFRYLICVLQCSRNWIGCSLLRANERFIQLVK